MELKNFYREIVNEHNLNPSHKRSIEAPDLTLRGVNPSCGDDITLELKLDENDVIVDAGFTGSGCAISQASADMMADQIIGFSKEEAVAAANSFIGMIHGEPLTEEQLETLDEAASLADIAHMPARAKCAILAWRTMREMLSQDSGTPHVISPEAPL